jgi:hypothetical protein
MGAGDARLSRGGTSTAEGRARTSPFLAWLEMPIDVGAPGLAGRLLALCLHLEHHLPPDDYRIGA